MQSRSFLALAALAILAGCNGNSGSNTAAPAATGIKVAMVTDVGGIDDHSFNAGSWEGLQKAQKELGVKAKFVESKEQADYKTNLSSLAEQNNDLVIAVGFMMEDAVKQVAAAFPKTKFAIIDGNAPAVSNAASLKFREEEGSFLAGFLAAKMSKKKSIGFVGGVESALIKKFESGYKAGAKTADPTVNVIAKYVGSWTDNGKGELIAQSIFESSDIIFAAAGKSGLGVLGAANKRGAGYYGIGVDLDQDGRFPGRILTSMMKSVSGAVYDAVKSVKDGAWKSGTIEIGVKEGGVHLSPMTYTKKDIPVPVLELVEKVRGMIASGAIRVPKTDEELAAFKAPAL